MVGRSMGYLLFSDPYLLDAVHQSVSVADTVTGLPVGSYSRIPPHRILTLPFARAFSKDCPASRSPASPSSRKRTLSQGVGCRILSGRRRHLRWSHWILGKVAARLARSMGMGRLLAHGRASLVGSTCAHRILGTAGGDQRSWLDKATRQSTKEKSLVGSHQCQWPFENQYSEQCCTGEYESPADSSEDNSDPRTRIQSRRHSDDGRRQPKASRFKYQCSAQILSCTGYGNVRSGHYHRCKYSVENQKFCTELCARHSPLLRM